jgi:thioredoxin 1
LARWTPAWRLARLSPHWLPSARPFIASCFSPEPYATIFLKLFKTPATMSSPNIINLTKDNFDSAVIKSHTPVCVDFWAEWCGPCKMIAPILDELADEYNGRVAIAKVNIDEHQNLATEYGVRAIPTLLLFHNGQVAEQIVGLRSKRDLKASFDKLA